MELRVPSRRRSLLHRLLTLVITIGMLCPALAVPPVVRADGPRPGENDPAQGYAKWPDHEIFQPTAPLDGANFWMGAWYPCQNLGGMCAYTGSFPPTDYHDAIAPVAGRILTPEHDSLLYAFRSGTGDLDINVWRGGTIAPVTTVPANLAARVAGGTDFFDMAAGDLDGWPTLQDGEYRDEVALAYAQPGTGNKLPVQLTVLHFGRATEADRTPGAVTTAAASGTLDAASVMSGAVKPVDNALGVATGDFDGNGANEIAVAYLTSPTAVTVDVFRYSVVIAGNHSIQPTLARIGSGSITLASGRAYNETISLAAGDFDGDHRDELALGTVDRATSGDSQAVHVRLLRFTGSSTLTVSQVSESVPATGVGGGTFWRVQVAAGLFTVHTPSSGLPNLSRRQIAVAYNNGTTIYVRTIDVNDSLQPAAPSAAYALGGTTTFWLTAGRFSGPPTTTDPYWSLVLANWAGTDNGYRWLQAGSNGGAPGELKRTGGDARVAPTSGVRLPPVAMDYDGDSLYLGAPVHMTVQNLVNLDYIIEEPPKHAFWNPSTQQVENVSRYDDFAIAMTSTTGQEFSSSTKDTTDYSIGASLAASAGQTVESHASCGVAKASEKASTTFTAKIGYDYQGHAADYTSNYADRKAFFSGRTDRDDFLVGRLQTFDIWRYRIFGMTTKDQDGNPATPFFDLVLPGPFTALVPGTQETQAGGLNFDWYQPVHENGNILSYPAYNASFLSPSDLGGYTIPCPVGDTACNLDGTKTVQGFMYGPVLMFWDQTSNLPAGSGLNFSTASGGGSERSYTHNLSENLSLKGTSETMVGIGNKVVGASATLSFSAEFEQHGKLTWGTTTTSNGKTTNSTGITIFKRAGTSEKAYGFWPVMYETANGTIKASYAVDPLASNTGKYWWITNYGQKPDLALNLPTRFQPQITPTGLVNWVPTTSDLRKQMRGLLFYKNEISPRSGAYIPLTGAATDGEAVRLEARVYNYSVTQGVPAGAQACFDASPYDPMTNTETVSGRTRIGCTALPALAPQEMTTAAVVWDTTGKGLGAAQAYRIYVVLDPGNTVVEKYETESTATATYCFPDATQPGGQKCIDPGQNNEGYGYATVVAPVVGDPRWGKPTAHVSMAKDAVAAIDPRGKLSSGNVQAYFGQPLHVRIAVDSDTPGTQYSTVLVYDGDPDQGGALIAGKQMFSGQAQDAVWLDWIPNTRGPHRLFAKVLQSIFDAAPGNNIGELKVEVIPAPPGLTR